MSLYGTYYQTNQHNCHLKSILINIHALNDELHHSQELPVGCLELSSVVLSVLHHVTLMRKSRLLYYLIFFIYEYPDPQKL